MKKKHYILLLLIISFSKSFSQNPFYYYFNQKIYLTLDKTSLNITVDQNFSKSMKSVGYY